MDPKDRKVMTAFYNYSEPFSCECRAFGRLQEAGHEDLAVDCFGYVLLDEDHERALHSQFPDKLFNGDPDDPYDDDADEAHNMRARFLGRDGRKPPIRGIVKEFCPPTKDADLEPEEAAKMLRNISQLQQLGIISLDVALRQMAGGRYCDFSKAITVPHYITTPELSPHLEPNKLQSMELQTFILSLDDYLAFDQMITEWNWDHEETKGELTVFAFPDGHGCPVLRSYELRNESRRERVFTYVDPRRYDWRQHLKEKKRTRTKRRLRAKPPLWIYCCGKHTWLSKMLRRESPTISSLHWDYIDGRFFPWYAPRY